MIVRKTAGALGKISAVASNCILYHHIFIVNKKVLLTVFDEAVKVIEKNLDPELFFVLSFFFFPEKPFCMPKYDDCHREKYLCNYLSFELN